jgi:pimeloyl-ACP methyl ester carboxylesterase
MAGNTRRIKFRRRRRRSAFEAQLPALAAGSSAEAAKKARLMAGVAGLSAVGTAAGVSAARTIRHRKAINDAYEGEDFALLEADRGCVVTTTDGIPLVVREVGPVTAPLTVVFAHGFCMRMGSFHFQRAALAERWGDQVRMVFYDQRGHGQSGAGPVDSYTVEQLGRDLETILQVMVPRGPIVVVGHSMGGMTVLSHARQFPERYGRRIVGAAIISSAAEGVTRSPLGEILNNPALEAVKFMARYVPNAVHRTRGAIRGAIRPIIRTASFGDDHISPSVVQFNEQMIHDTSIDTLVAFLHALEVHEEAAALPVLARIPTLIACGDQDLLTPAKNSEEMAAALPDSLLVIVPGAAHVVMMERPEVINNALVRLVERATPSRLVAFTRRLRDRIE